MNKNDIIKYIDEKAAAEIVDISHKVWEYAELSLKETKSAALYVEKLRAHGFAVETGQAGIETAFTGTYVSGAGKPVIGILGEFDALSGLSQKACATKHEEIVKDGPGHGCGHNMLGAAAYGSALAVKEYLEKTGADGTVIFYGCPGVSVSYIASYPITVIGGTSDVSKACAGSTVTLTVGDAPEGKTFDQWTVNMGEVEVTVVDEKTATFVMPAGYVQITASFKNKEPQNNTLSVRGKKTKLKAKKLKKKAQKVSRGKVMVIRNPQGRLTYKLLKVSKSRYKKYFKINSRNGVVTVKKKLKKGTYTIRCRVTASGNEVYKSGSRVVSFKITVK